jgi:uncharacterized protein (DUF1778 family)
LQDAPTETKSGFFAFRILGMTEGDGAMCRTDRVDFRVTDEERSLIKALAHRLQRNESDMIRLVIRNVAEELGVTLAAKNERMEKQAA